ncbi:PEP/pyruvate-binding domain-containing protein [Vogesella sp. GCM10023246]|uniref:PEP/pyruvate-binding domain-containing protein n=1 Tax=Vogesella oryzagri TaxID=3160864 RepID=A0ABV1M4D4_9NEIS
MLDWSAVRAAGAEQSGGKAARLAQLAGYGLPVPDGRVLPASLHRQWLAAGRPALAQWPPLVAALQQLPATWRALPLAVRSSALAEDGSEYSFAGIHASVLGVRGEAALLQAIAEVYASIDTPQAHAYRQRFDIAEQAVAMAVLIMPLLDAEAAGVAFSCNPANGRQDQLLIQATFGLGEALVAGAADPDEALLTVALHGPHTVEHYRVGRKQQQSRVQIDGRVALQAGGPQGRVLDEDSLQQLAELCRDVAEALDDTRPCFDIEWLRSGGRFWLLQARPVTQLDEALPPGLAPQGGFWSNGNSRDVAPYVMTPLDWSSSRVLVNRLLTSAMRHCGYRPHPGAERSRLFAGRLYLHLSLIQWEMCDSLGVTPAVINELTGGYQPEITPAPATLRRRLAIGWRMLKLMRATAGIRRGAERHYRQALAEVCGWRQRIHPGISDDALCQALLQLTQQVDANDSLHFLQASGGGSLSLLLKLLDKHAPGRSHALSNGLLADNPLSITAQQNLQLLQLAALAGQDPALAAWLHDSGRDNDNWRQRWPQGTPFGDGFAVFLDDYGHRAVYESDSSQPRWREAPGYLFDALAGLVRVDAAALTARRSQQAQQAYAATRRVLPWWWRPLLRPLVRQCALELGQRELARSGIVAYLEPLRQLLRLAGERMVQRGTLNEWDDVFYLTGRELVQALHGARGGSFAALAADRRRQRAAWQTQQLPDVIHYGASHAATPPVAAVSGELLQGLPVASGRARGRVCRLLQPADGARLQPGDILLAPSTDPAWTPLFLKAGGLIMETGGYLSHGAIVAREFGVPAVVNLPGVLALLQDGELVEVCGSSGTVRRLEQT